MEIKLERIFHFSPLPVYKFPSETGPKLAQKKKPLTRNPCKWLTCFAPQPGLEPDRALRKCPVGIFSEGDRLQGGLKSCTK